VAKYYEIVFLRYALSSEIVFSGKSNSIFGSEP